MDERPDELFDDADDVEEFEDITEAYCMVCKETTPMDNPEAIWTRRGAPGTRGMCSVCGTTVFRMGMTTAHQKLKRPDPVHVAESPRGKARGKLPDANVTYINYSVSDAAFAESLAEDLNRIGIQTWLAESEVTDVQWATKVHPALVQCKQMVVVLTPLASKATNVTEALDFFAKQRKPIFVAQLQPGDVPDALRRKPRFDFSGEGYKAAFRGLVEALTTTK